MYKFYLDNSRDQKNPAGFSINAVPQLSLGSVSFALKSKLLLKQRW